MRIYVVGTSGSGKSTVAAAAARRLGVPHTELDAIRHQANWVELPDPQFRERVATAVAGESWVIDGNYSVVRDLILPRATHVIWLDLPRWLVMWQVASRSVRRAALRQELWNGNRETFRHWLDPGHPIRWAWSTHARRQRDYAAAMDRNWQRLRTRREIRDWLASL